MWQIDQMKKYINEVESMLVEKDKQIEKLKNTDFNQFKQFVNQTGWNSYKGVKPKTKWYTTCRPYSSPTEALAALDAAYTNVQEIDKQNEEIGKYNTTIYDKIVMLLESCGLTKTESKKKSPRSSKYITVSADWYSNIRAAMPKRQGYYRSSVEMYNSYKLEIEKWQTEIDTAKKQEEEAAKRKEKTRKQNLELCAFLVKYNLESDVEAEDILDIILNKCKYLKLAHYLQENRSDWNDGPNYAIRGLSGFTIETEIDKDIYDEINGLIQDWDGDGRCFRDCEFNYDTLFDMVDETLYNDYMRVTNLIAKE